MIYICKWYYHFSTCLHKSWRFFETIALVFVLWYYNRKRHQNWVKLSGISVTGHTVVHISSISASTEICHSGRHHPVPFYENLRADALHVSSAAVRYARNSAPVVPPPVSLYLNGAADATPDLINEIVPGRSISDATGEARKGGRGGAGGTRTHAQIETEIARGSGPRAPDAAAAADARGQQTAITLTTCTTRKREEGARGVGKEKLIFSWLLAF